MATFNCKMCGGRLYAQDNAPTAVCEYCGTVNTLPVVNEDRVAKLFDRANERRRSSEFDDAMGIYENILAEDNTIAEAYWGIVLCRFGIEYVKDPQTFEMKPTCHRTILSSIFSDPEYKKALQYADDASKKIYEKEAADIDRIQKKIIEISSKEKPYDVFICYKENEEGYGRTEDSSIAQDICTYLTNDGLKVFFARITLRAMAGAAYEPYIFAALNTARVMIVIGTKTEYFDAPWVKNEWSRFLAMMKNDRGKVLIPCYKNMSPQQLPAAFVHAEALNISTSTFMLDLIRSIRKVIPKKEKQTAQTVIQGVAGNAESLRKRGKIFLGDHEFKQAEEYFGKSLDMDPESCETYWCMLLAKRQCADESELIAVGRRFNDMAEYRNALRFASDKQKQEIEKVAQAIEDKISSTVSTLKKSAKEHITQTGLFDLVHSSRGVYEETVFKINGLLEELKQTEDDIKACVDRCTKSVLADPLEAMMKNDEEMRNQIMRKILGSDAVSDNDQEEMKREAKRLLEDTMAQKAMIDSGINSNADYVRMKELRAKKENILSELNTNKEVLKRQITMMDETLKKSRDIRSSYKPAWEAVQRGDYSLGEKLN